MKQHSYTPGIANRQQVDEYQECGYLVVEHLVDPVECDELRARAAEMVHDFDPAEVVSVFSTHEQNQLTDDYFCPLVELRKIHTSELFLLMTRLSRTTNVILPS